MERCRLALSRCWPWSYSAKDGGEKRALRNAVEGDTVAGLTNIMTVLGAVLESLVTVSNSTDKVAAVFAVDFFHNALEFFYSLSNALLHAFL